MKRYLCCLMVLAQVAAAQEQDFKSVVTVKDVPMGGSEKMVNIGLSQELRKDVAQRLNKLLSDEYALYIKTQKFHWNVVGPNFGPLHKLFNKQYDQLALVVDEVAERVRALGFLAFGSLAEFIENTTISEDPGVNPDAQNMIKILLNDHEAIIRELREQIKYTASKEDLGTENFLADLIVKHQKIAWMLRAHLLKE